MMVKNHNHLGVVLAVAAGTLVAGGLLLLMLLVVVEPAGAAFPGQNGKIAFASYRAGGLDIYTINSNGTGDPVRLTNNPAHDREPAWSPDRGPLPGGNKIAFTSDRDGAYEIYTMNPSLATELGPLGLIFTPTDRLTNNSAWDVQPAWSPDGKKIAFASNRDDGQLSPTGECVGSGSCNWNIYTINADGTGGLDRLTSDPAQDYQPAWSPDGNKIAFTHNGGGPGGIYTMNANEFGGPVPLTHDRDTEPAWSPDARKIAFTRKFGGGMFSRDKDIYTINANGTGEEDELTTTATLVIESEPAWSPDGNKIAFTRGNEIYTMNPNGSGVVPLNSSNGVIGQEHDWQPLRQTPVLPPRQLQP
jgi:Tol biopolymer transport system component